MIITEADIHDKNNLKKLYRDFFTELYGHKSSIPIVNQISLYTAQMIKTFKRSVLFDDDKWFVAKNEDNNELYGFIYIHVNDNIATIVHFYVVDSMRMKLFRQNNKKTTVTKELILKSIEYMNNKNVELLQAQVAKTNNTVNNMLNKRQWKIYDEDMEYFYYQTSVGENNGYHR